MTVAIDSVRHGGSLWLNRVLKIDGARIVGEGIEAAEL